MPEDDEKSPQENPGSPDGAKRDQGVAGWYGLIGIGFEFLAAICLVGGIGFYLDRRLGTSPWLLIVGGAVGFAIGLTMVIRAGLGAFKD